MIEEEVEYTVSPDELTSDDLAIRVVSLYRQLRSNKAVAEALGVMSSRIPTLLAHGIELLEIRAKQEMNTQGSTVEKGSLTDPKELNRSPPSQAPLLPEVRRNLSESSVPCAAITPIPPAAGDPYRGMRVVPPQQLEVPPRGSGGVVRAVQRLIITGTEGLINVEYIT